MSIKKRYFKTKPFCTVTFKLEKDAASSFERAAVVGEFNDWDTRATEMTRLKDGSFKVNVNLEPGRAYQFRYLLNDDTWQNDPEAEEFVPTEFHDAENSLVRI